MIHFSKNMLSLLIAYSKRAHWAEQIGIDVNNIHIISRDTACLMSKIVQKKMGLFHYNVSPNLDGCHKT